MPDLLFDIDAEPAVVKPGAILSECGRYRYALTRTWLDARPPACFCMLNPSTADASKDDPTIRRCMAFARRWGHGGIVVVNLFAWRATNPAELWKATDPVGPTNDAYIAETARDRQVIAAWGCLGATDGRDRKVMGLLAGRAVECLGTTKDGHPRHPLYIRGDSIPRPFRLPEVSRA